MGITGLVGATPVPIAVMPVITGLQLSMIGTIAMISGEKLNRKSIIQFLGAMGVNVGVGVALRTISRQLVKVFPGAGSVISGAIASAGTRSEERRVGKERRAGWETEGGSQRG